MKKGQASGKNHFSRETIKRLSLYLRNLKELKAKGINIVSSDKITKFVGSSPEQFRKDLSYFGEFGKRGVGYNVQSLISEIESILGLDQECRIAIVGAGRLGSALLGFEGFTKFNLNIVAAFDSDPEKIGKKRKNITVNDIDSISKVIRSQKIKIAIISTPPQVAQAIADKLAQAGVRAILNFAPVILKVKRGVAVSNVDMGCELESLAFFTKKGK